MPELIARTHSTTPTNATADELPAGTKTPKTVLAMAGVASARIAAAAEQPRIASQSDNVPLPASFAMSLTVAGRE